MKRERDLKSPASSVDNWQCILTEHAKQPEVSACKGANICSGPFQNEANRHGLAK